MLNKIRKMLKQQEGFTLMELMIVVVIIGILAGIAVPIYNGVQERARKGVGEANATMLNRSIISWEQLENDGKSYNQETDEDDLLEFLGLTEVEYVQWQDDQYTANPSVGAKIPSL